MGESQTKVWGGRLKGGGVGTEPGTSDSGIGYGVGE